MGRRKKERHERGLSNLLDVDFLRRVLGFDPNDFDEDVYTNDQGQRPLILVFHDGGGDEAKLKNIGWHPFKHGAAIATLDTRWIVEDNYEFSGFLLGRSTYMLLKLPTTVMLTQLMSGLSDFVVKFEIPRKFEWQQPDRKKGKRVVRGHHNAGNDAFETMAALLGQAAHDVSDKALTGLPLYPYPNNEPSTPNGMRATRGR